MNTCVYWSTVKPATPDACRFITPDDWLSLALSAYYAASRDLQPPTGEPWEVEGAVWSTPEDFVLGLEMHVQRRLLAAAVAAHVCHEADEVAPDAAPAEAAEPETPARASGLEGGPGVAGAAPPPVMGHGWPASECAGSAALTSVEAGNADRVSEPLTTS